MRHGKAQIAQRLIFQVVTIHPFTEQPLHIHIVIMGTYHQNPQVGVLLAYLPNGANGVKVGHVDINNQQIGLGLGKGWVQGGSIPHFTHNF